MAMFDLVLRGGRLIDGTGSAGRRADVGVSGDRITAVGDLSGVDPAGTTVIECAGRVVAPGFIDPHGHSDGSVLVDGALASHLHQGFTTQLSGNCGASVAPVTDAGRDHVDLLLRPDHVELRWRTFGEYLDVVAQQPVGPNVAFLVGQGTIRGSVLGAEAAPPTAVEVAAMVREVDAAMEAGAFGLSSGLIYAPGMHAGTPELVELVRASASRGGLYATHMRNEADGLFGALDEAIATVRDAGPRARLQVSHLKCASRAVWGRAGHAVGRLEAARAEGLDVAADQYPYTAANTSLETILPAALLALGVDECVAALRDPGARDAASSEMRKGNSSWENVTADPGWNGMRIAFAPSHPDWSGRSIAELAAEMGRDAVDVAFDALIDDRLDVSIVIECMDEPDVESIMAVPWIAVCTDAEGRRPGHPVLDAGRPHPRTYGTTARVLGRYVRERGTLPLETAVAKMTSVPAERIGLVDRGVVREGAFADLVVFDPVTVLDHATDSEPARYPTGIDDVIVNGRVAIRGGAETGECPGRLLRHESARSFLRGGYVARRMPLVIATESDAIARLPGGAVPYTLRRSPRSRGLRVVIHPARGVVVTVPPASRRGWAHPEPLIGDFLAEREAWLRHHLLSHANERAELAARGGLRDGAQIRYRGDLHRLRIEPAGLGARRSSVERIGGLFEDELVIRHATRDTRTTEMLLTAFLKPRARDAIEHEIGRHAPALGVTPVAVTVRDQRTRWGSASRQGRLAFSWRLVLAPPEALETVVIHELAHLRVFGHGPRFWEVVASRRPDHKVWRRWLRDHSTELHHALDDGATT